MKPREIVFAPEAREDISRLYDWIVESGGPAIALSYVQRIEKFCTNLDLASERGQRRDDIRPGLRVVGFERRLTIAFEVADDRVIILRMFYAGRDWQNEPF